MKFIQMVEPLSQFINLLLEYFGFYNQEDNVRITMLPVSHFDKKEKQAQPYSLFLRKYSFYKNQISSRAYIDIEVYKYYKIYLGKIIFWPWVLKTSEASCKKLQNWKC